jgi:hypothetical protein
VVTDTELLHKRNETMNRVFAHVGLPPFDVGRFTEADLQLKYPLFWSLWRF